jgi:acid stress-induced BolA-like protein IbaG/YrbA
LSALVTGPGANMTVTIIETFFEGAALIARAFADIKDVSYLINQGIYPQNV